MESLEDIREFAAKERLYLGKTDAVPEDVEEHLDRYRFACSLLTPQMYVVDAACGTGYGTELVASKAHRVVGLEKSHHALLWAKAHHAGPSINYRYADLARPLPYPPKLFDAVISFETLEHVENPDALLSEFARVLKDNGLLIISTPDRNILTDKAGSENRFHIGELSKKEFLDVLRIYFSDIALYGQRRYVELSWPKKMVSLLVRLDIFKVRRLVLKFSFLRQLLYKKFLPAAHSSLEPIAPDAPSAHYTLVALGRKIPRA